MIPNLGTAIPRLMIVIPNLGIVIPGCKMTNLDGESVGILL